MSWYTAPLRIAAAVRILPFGWRFVREAEVREERDIEVVEVGPGPLDGGGQTGRSSG